MSEYASSGPEGAPKRGGIPRWIWFCGGGCALMVLVGVIGLFVAGRYFQKAMDPERQWARLGEVLPHDPAQRPAGELFGMKIPFQPVEFWVLHDPAAGLQAQIVSVGGAKSGEARREIFQSHADPGRRKLEEGEVEVQGRTLQVTRMTVDPAAGASPAQPGAEPEPDSGGFMAEIRRKVNVHVNAASAVVDLSPAGSEDLLLLILSRAGLDEESARMRIEDEEIQRFLAPFHVGERR